MRVLRVVLLAILAAFVLSLSAHEESSSEATEAAHSGGTDKCGCHYNRKPGEYHCHKRKQRGGDCPP
jgi:hypothetical protein